MAKECGHGNGSVWVWRTLAGIILFLMAFTTGTVGYAIQDSMSGVRNATNIEGIKESLVRIEKNIKRLLDQ